MLQRGARRGLRGRLPGPGRHGQRLRPRHRAAPGRRRLHLRRGDGAALEPRRVPRPAPPAPPFPAVEGLYESPTVINNVETLMNVPHIVNNGAGLVQGGRHREGARHEDVHDLRQGRAPWELRAADGHAAAGAARGARRRRARGQGAQGVDRRAGPRPVPHRRPPRRRPRLRVRDGGRLLLGTGAIMVLDETDCMVEAARRLVEFYAHESCGKCTPCREGTWWATRVLGRIEGGYGRERGPAAHGRHGREHPVPGVLRLADGAVSPIQSTLKHFMDEYEAHIREGRCPVPGRTWTRGRARAARGRDVRDDGAVRVRGAPS